MQSKKPVALETIPVSRKPGQYLLQSMVAAQLDAKIASTIKTIFNTGCFKKQTIKKEPAETENEIKMVKSIFRLRRSYKKMEIKVLIEMIKVATVKICADVSEEKLKY